MDGQVQDAVSNSQNASNCKNTALRLVARAEQCSSGLIRKLEKRGFDSKCVNTVVSQLIEMDLVNDQRFARLWIESHLRLAKSPNRLIISLCARGIDRGEAQEALKAVLDEETEFAILSRFVKKYSGKYDNQQSLRYALNSEGFSREVIQRYFDCE